MDRYPHLSIQVIIIIGYLRSFQFKILNNILDLNKKFHTFGLSNTQLCSFSKMAEEIISHLLHNTLWILSQKSKRNFRIKELRALENHVLVNLAHTVLARSKIYEAQNFLNKRFSVSLKKGFIFHFHIYFSTSFAFYFIVSIYIYIYIYIANEK